MSAPAGGGRTYTLNPSQSAGTCLTERAGGSDDPVTVINLSSGRAWLGTDSGVGPSNGVPLDGGTSIPWTTPGQLWAVADPGETAPVQLVATAAVDGWTPSPYAIAAATAAQLLTTGVPNVLSVKFVGKFAVQPFPAGATGFDSSEYAALFIACLPSGVQVDVSFSMGTPSVRMNGGADLSSGNVYVPVTGATAYLSNMSSTTPVDVYVWGTNRDVPAGRSTAAGFAENGCSLSTGTQAMAANTAYQLIPTPGSYAFQGPAFAHIELSGSAILGRLQAVLFNGAVLNLWDSTSITGTPTANIGRSDRLMLALPANVKQFQFVCTTAGTGNVLVDLVPAY